MDYWHPKLSNDELQEQSRHARRQMNKSKLKSFGLYLFDNWIAITALIVSIVALVRSGH